MPTIKIADKPTLDQVAEGVADLQGRRPFDLDAFMYWFGGLASSSPGDEVENWMQRTMAAVDVPTAKRFGDYALYNCQQLMSISAPMVTAVGEHAFDSCVLLTTVRMPMLESIAGFATYNCQRLKKVTLPSVKIILNHNFFDIETLVLPGNTVPTIAGYSMMNTTCKIYVPQALMDAYRTETNWAAYYNRGQILSIEDHPEVMGGDG